jgi:hypothetical protein
MDLAEIRLMPELMRKVFPLRQYREKLMGINTEGKSTAGEPACPFSDDNDSSVDWESDDNKPTGASSSSAAGEHHRPTSVLSADGRHQAGSAEHRRATYHRHEISEEEGNQIQNGNPSFTSSPFKDVQKRLRAARFSVLHPSPAAADHTPDTGNVAAQGTTEHESMGHAIDKMLADCNRISDDTAAANEAQRDIFRWFHGELGVMKQVDDKQREAHKKLAMQVHQQQLLIEEMQLTIAQLTGRASDPHRRVVSDNNSAHRRSAAPPDNQQRSPRVQHLDERLAARQTGPPSGVPLPDGYQHSTPTPARQADLHRHRMDSPTGRRISVHRHESSAGYQGQPQSHYQESATAGYPPTYRHAQSSGSPGSRDSEYHHHYRVQLPMDMRNYAGTSPTRPRPAGAGLSVGYSQSTTATDTTSVATSRPREHDGEFEDDIYGR